MRNAQLQPFYGGLGEATSVGRFLDAVVRTLSSSPPVVSNLLMVIIKSFKEALMPHTIQISEFNTNHVITQVNNQLITTSKLVAETFGKLHKDILKKIQNLDCSNEFASANFCAHVENTKVGAVNRDSKFYNITKDGFMFLVMGFTGKKAARIKEAYINAFNDMENRLYKPKVKTLTFYQANHIKSVVGKIGQLNETSTAATYQAIRERFDVTSYQHIPIKRYAEVCEFLNCEPLVGEFLEAEKPKQKEFPKPTGAEKSKRGFSRMVMIYKDDMLVDSRPLRLTDGILSFEQPEVLKEMVRDMFPQYALVKKSDILSALNMK